MLSRKIVACAVVLLALGLAGCARVEQALTPEPEVVTIEATVAVPSASVEGELAEGLPADVPLWPGAQVRRSEATDSAYTFTLVTDEAFDDVVAGLAAGFEKGGWEVFEEDVEATEGDAGRTTALTVSGPTSAGIVTIIEGDDAAVSIAYVITSVE